MQDQRLAAKERGDVTFAGSDCKWNHGGERYVSSGACVQCVKDRSTEGRESKKKQTMSEHEVQALLLRGGPNSREMAEVAGLNWYNHPRDFRGACHAIIGLDGMCPLCGGATPEPVQLHIPSAQELLA